jgi:hypothetical protein
MRLCYGPRRDGTRTSPLGVGKERKKTGAGFKPSNASKKLRMQKYRRGCCGKVLATLSWMNFLLAFVPARAGYAMPPLSNVTLMRNHHEAVFRNWL